MRFRIVGADKQTGEAINTIIEAPDQFHAMRQARDGGVLVSEVIEVQETPIQRVMPNIIQSHDERMTEHPSGPAQARPVVYVIERQMQVPAPAPATAPAAAPTASPAPVTIVPLVIQPQIAAAPPPPPAQITTHVHVSNNSSSVARVPAQPGCLSAIAKLAIVGVALAAVGIWVQRSFNNKTGPFAPTPSSRPPSPARSSTSPSKRPARAVAPTKPAPPASSPAIADAERACLDVLRQQQDYIAVKNTVDEYEAKVRAARADPRHPLLQSLSEQWMDAKNRLSKMESDALANDPAVQAAKRP